MIGEKEAGCIKVFLTVLIVGTIFVCGFIICFQMMMVIHLGGQWFR